MTIGKVICFIVYITFMMIGFIHSAYAGIDEFIPSMLKAKVITSIEIPVKALEIKDPRVQTIINMAATIAIKRKLNLDIQCPGSITCDALRKATKLSLPQAANNVANGNKFIAKELLKTREIIFSSGNRYVVHLVKKGL